MESCSTSFFCFVFFVGSTANANGDSTANANGDSPGVLVVDANAQGEGAARIAQR